MEIFAADAAVECLESQLAGLAGAERVRALVEFAWHLRERDTRRARTLALEAAHLVGTPAGIPDSPEILALAAWVRLTLAECDALFLALDASRSEAARAFAAFNAAGDTAGRHAARWLLTRLARAAGNERPEPPACAGRVALECHAAFDEATARMHAGAADHAVEAFLRVARVARCEGMRVLALEARLGCAHAFAAVGDEEAAGETAQEVLEAARANGWRSLAAAASAMLSRMAVAAGRARQAIELLDESLGMLAAAGTTADDGSLHGALGEARLAAGDPAGALDALERSEALLRARSALPSLAHAVTLQARALDRTGRRELAFGRATEALAIARQARTRAAEMEALRVLAELHAPATGGADDFRTALAFLRHALDIAAEIEEPREQSSILRDLARLHEASGDVPAALGAERLSRAADAAAERRRAADQVRAARARELRERARLEGERADASRRLAADRSRDLEACQALHQRLQDAGRAITQRTEVAAIVEALEECVAAAGDSHGVALFVIDAAGQGLRRHAREGGRAIPVREIAMGDVDAYVARCARDRRELLIELESRRGDFSTGDPATLWFGPVVDGDRLLGVLSVQSRRPKAYGEAERFVLRSACGYAGVALARTAALDELARQRALCAEAEERIQRLSTADALTGLAARAHFFSVARSRLERLRRDAGPCGLIVCDVDGFKGINDTRGHRTGDRVLAAVARVLADGQRPDDVAGRIGGDEFALLLPGASLEATVRVAERIRTAIESMRIVHDARPVSVTASFGCTALADTPHEIADVHADAAIERLAREAEAGLYEAQGTGGNRTIAWPAYQALRALRTGERLERTPQSLV